LWLKVPRDLESGSLALMVKPFLAEFDSYSARWLSGKAAGYRLDMAPV